MTLDEAYEYVDQSEQHEGEARAEYGSGAVSLGYDGSEAMLYYDGYRCSEDPQYAEAQKIIAEHNVVRVVRWIPINPDDIPF